MRTIATSTLTWAKAHERHWIGRGFLRRREQMHVFQEIFGDLIDMRQHVRQIDESGLYL